MQDYTEFVISRLICQDGDEVGLAALGLAGETGEVVDHLKKYLYHGKPINREAVLLEMGDVFFYYTMLMKLLDTDIEEITSMNMAKLKKRYPNEQEGRHLEAIKS